MTKNIFCDIDGTILRDKKNLLEPPEILNGVLEKFEEWNNNNYKIILFSERKESCRKQTKEQLRMLGINY